MKLILAGDKWDMGWGAMSLGWARWGAERAHGLCMTFSSSCCPDCDKLETPIVSEDARRNSDSKEVESKWLKGGSSARGYIIILKLKI